MAKQTLFIGSEDIKKRSPMGGNVDTDKYLQSVALVQSTELKPILGVDLMARITDEIDASSVSADIETLLDLYIKDFLVNYAVADYALTANYQITNGGISTFQPSNGSFVSTDEVIRLTNKLENKAKHYGQNMIEFLNDNKTLYPEFKGTNTDSNFHGWVIGDDGNCF